MASGKWRMANGQEEDKKVELIFSVNNKPLAISYKPFCGLCKTTGGGMASGKWRMANGQEAQ